MKKRHPVQVREWAMRQIMPPLVKSMEEVASKLGVTTQTLRNWKKEFGVRTVFALEVGDAPLMPVKKVRPPEILVGGGQANQIRYRSTFRAWALEQMSQPLNRPIAMLAKETGVAPATLRAWRELAIAEGKMMGRSRKPGETWSGADKFRMVLEAAPLSEIELSEYCRRNGIYQEQLMQWRQACELANGPMADPPRPTHTEIKVQARRIKKLERDLAETKALLDLRKKAEAIWGKDAEE